MTARNEVLKDAMIGGFSDETVDASCSAEEPASQKVLEPKVASALDTEPASGFNVKSWLEGQSAGAAGWNGCEGPLGSTLDNDEDAVRPRYSQRKLEPGQVPIYEKVSI